MDLPIAAMEPSIFWEAGASGVFQKLRATQCTSVCSLRRRVSSSFGTLLGVEEDVWDWVIDMDNGDSVD